jgi:hypothetical protein
MMWHTFILGLASVQFSDGFRNKRRSQANVSSFIWPHKQTTVSGCECSGRDVCNGWECDTCATKWLCNGLKDFCVYPQQDSFESQTADEKLDYYWVRLSKNPKLTVEHPSFLEIVGNFFQSVRTSFDNWLPEMPKGRKKLIHTVGSVAKIEFEVKNSPYTGLLGNGVHKGFIRMGLAKTTDDDGIMPGTGWKFPRSGVPSGDFVAMHTLSPGQSWNFLKNNISNKLPVLTGGGIMGTALKLLENKFKEASPCAVQVGISDLAKYSSDGTEHNPPQFPYKLFFVPSNEVQRPEVKKTIPQIHDELNSITAGTKLFTVYACDKQTENEHEPITSVEGSCGASRLLGTVKTISETICSEYGDKHFFIRHQRVEEDWMYKPQYKVGMQAACGLESGDSLEPTPVCGK